MFGSPVPTTLPTLWPSPAPSVTQTPTLASIDYAQIAKLAASDAGVKGGFGYSMAIDGDTIVVGAHTHDDGGSDSGSVYVFRTSDGGATYDQVAKLTASDAAASDLFGNSVAIDGDTILVGA